MPYHESLDFEATRTFYTRVLGLEEGSFGGGYIGFGPVRRRSSSGHQACSPCSLTWAWTSIRAKPSTRRTLKPFGVGTRSSRSG
jgi:catechol 2,3-dioxygenase-like lactoylglutathione lyase family enzyme